MSKTIEELDSEFGHDGWVGVLIKSSNTLVACRKPKSKVWKETMAFIKADRIDEANEHIVCNTCITHTSQQLTDIFDDEPLLVAQLSTKLGELMNDNLEDAKKKPR